jgi:hypothetical protein
MGAMLSRHFTLSRRSYQEPCAGTGLVVDEDAGTGVQICMATCPDCGQEVVLTNVTPSVSSAGEWMSRFENKKRRPL